MQKKFTVFGDPAELLVLSAQTAGNFSVGRQTCQPGGGTPPHLHQNEDEVFSVISGRFETYDGDTDTWTEVPPQGLVYAPRGHVHCFRNCGDTEGTIQFVCTGNRFDTFLEGLSRFHLSEDVQAIVDYSAAFGILYPTLPPPSPGALRSSDDLVGASAN